MQCSSFHDFAIFRIGRSCPPGRCPLAGDPLAPATVGAPAQAPPNRLAQARASAEAHCRARGRHERHRTARRTQQERHRTAPTNHDITLTNTTNGKPVKKQTRQEIQNGAAKHTTQTKARIVCLSPRDSRTLIAAGPSHVDSRGAIVQITPRDARRFTAAAQS